MARYHMRGRRVIARLVMVPEPVPAAPEPEPIPEPEPVRNLWFTSTAELVAMAEARGLDTTGSRSDLIGRLS